MKLTNHWNDLSESQIFKFSICYFSFFVHLNSPQNIFVQYGYLIVWETVCKKEMLCVCFDAAVYMHWNPKKCYHIFFFKHQYSDWSTTLGVSEYFYSVFKHILCTKTLTLGLHSNIIQTPAFRLAALLSWFHYTIIGVWVSLFLQSGCTTASLH
jgi:hypothetical protein